MHPPRTVCSTASYQTNRDDQNGDEFFADLKREKVEAESRAVFSSSVFQGASIRLGKTADDEATAERLARLPRVKKMWPVHMMRPPAHEVVWVANDSLSTAANHDRLQRRQGGRNETTTTAFSPHVMTQVDKLHAEGFTGRGIKVAVLDTGVDYRHPALGGCFGAGCVVSYGADLVGDAYDGSNTPVPDDDPFESCAGSYHGTHVVGTIAAQANNPFGFLGAAPDVTLGVYKVFGCTGGVAEDVLIAALLRAFDDGSDVITASIGSSSGWSERPSAVAAQRIVEAGVPVTIAAGNEGNRGMFYAASGATGRGVTSVAMVDNDVGVYPAKRASFLVIDDDDEDDAATNATDFGWLNATPYFAENVTLPLYATSNTTDGLDAACQPLDDQTPDLADFIVLVRQDDARVCTAAQQARHIADKGGRYLLWYSPGTEMASPYFGNEVPEVVGVAVVSKEQGASWTRLLNAGRKVVVDITAAAQADLTFLEQANTVSGGLVNSRSTWGPSWELDLKPTFATVGGSILSTYPVSMGSYGVLSGTSMSTPLAAAIYAIVAQARGVRDPALLERLLTSTARRTAWGPDPAAGLASVAQQGAGLAQAYAAAHTTTLLSVAHLALNDSDHHVGETSFSISNTGAADAVYTLAHVPALSMDTFGPGSGQAAAFPNPVAAGAADVVFSAARVAVPAGGSADVSVRIAAPASLDPARLPVYSGWVTVTGSRPNDTAVALPYLGVRGSMRDTALFDAATFTMYNMTQWPETIPADAGPLAFYLPYPSDFEAPIGVGIGWPYLQFRLRVGTRALYVDLMRVSASEDEDEPPKSVGSIRQYPGFFVTRATSFFTFNGMLDDGSVAPAGRYFVRVRAQKIFGDPASADGWETRDFPEFDIVYTTASPSLGS